jgi:hypothetical protein
MLDVLNNESLLLEASIDGLEKVMIVNISEKRKPKYNFTLPSVNNLCNY